MLEFIGSNQFIKIYWIKGMMEMGIRENICTCVKILSPITVAKSTSVSGSCKAHRWGW